MNASEDYCDLCDLPRSQCIHGRPVPTVQKAATPARSATTGRVAVRRSPVPDKPVTRRWTPPEAFKPLVLEVLERAGGELEAEELFAELEIASADLLLPGDHEKTPEGELRWQYAARRARLALIEEGLMAKVRPGVWQLARTRRDLGG